MTIPDGLPVLSYSCHQSPAEGACVMEYVSILAGLPFSDQPNCTELVLGEYARSLNDSLPDEFRHKMLPLIPKLIGTAVPGPARAGLLVGRHDRMEAWYSGLQTELHRWVDQGWLERTSYRAPWALSTSLGPLVRETIDRAITRWVAEFTAFVDEWNTAIGRTPEPLTTEQTRTLAAAVG